MLLVEGLKQTNGIQNPGIPHATITNELMTQVQKKFNGGKIVFSKPGAETTGYPQTKKKKKKKKWILIYTLHLTQKLTQKQIRDLNVKQTIKLAKNNIGKNFQDLGLGEEILNMTLIQERKKIQQIILHQY